jgi:DNA primase
VDIELVRDAVGRGSREGSSGGKAGLERNSPTYLLEREVLKSILQHSELATTWQELAHDDFADEGFASVFQVIISAPKGPTSIADLVSGSNPEVAALITELTVEPMRATEPTIIFVDSLIARLREVSVTRRITELKSSLQRLDPESTEYGPTFTQLVSLEAVRRALHEKGLGEALL